MCVCANRPLCFIKAFVNAVKKNVDEVEESVANAERELGSHTIQKVLSSIPGLRQVCLKSIRNKSYLL